MTESNRIAINILATYGRSLYALALGLVCGRLTLQALGEVDYGLCGVIGGLTIFISYFNTIIVGAIGRFYAVAVGRERTDPVGGLEECHRWFTTAVMIQVTWPTILLIVGYPLGIWAIHNFLTIPPDRVGDCVWVWRFTCITSYISMVTTPLSAMYTSKQYIAELTIYSFVTMTLNAIFVFYMATHPGVWLVRVSLWSSFLAIGPHVIIAIRAIYLFPECRFKLRYMKCWGSVKELGNFAFWNALGIFGSYARGQGMTLLVNKFFGPRVNAGMTIGQTVSGHCNTLSGSMVGAFSPAIYNAWGSGDHDQARRFAFRVCKIGTLMIMVFAVPMMLEVNEVLHLWLGTPPQYAAELCVFVLIEMMIEKLSIGHLLCIAANGKMALFQIIGGLGQVLSIPLAIVLIYLGVDVPSVGWGLVLTMAFVALMRVLFARTLVAMPIGDWVKRVLLPLVGVALLSLVLGGVPRSVMTPSFLRVCATTLLVELLIIPMSWRWILDADERMVLASKARQFLHITR